MPDGSAFGDGIPTVLPDDFANQAGSAVFQNQIANDQATQQFQQQALADTVQNRQQQGALQAAQQVAKSDSGLVWNGSYYQDPNFASNVQRYGDEIGKTLGPTVGQFAIAQARLETGGGSSLSTPYNYGNVGNTDDNPRGGGRYGSPEEAAQAWVRFITNNGNDAPGANRYNAFTQAGKHGADVGTLAQLIKNAGYATDPNYAGKIASIAGQPLSNPTVSGSPVTVGSLAASMPQAGSQAGPQAGVRSGPAVVETKHGFSLELPTMDEVKAGTQSLFDQLGQGVKDRLNPMNWLHGMSANLDNVELDDQGNPTDPFQAAQALTNFGLNVGSMTGNIGEGAEAAGSLAGKAAEGAGQDAEKVAGEAGASAPGPEAPMPADAGASEPPMPPAPPVGLEGAPMPPEPTPPLDGAGAAGRSADDILGAVPKDYAPVPSELPPNMEPVNIDLTKYSPEAQAATVKMADAMGGFASTRFQQTNAATVQKALDLMHDPAQWDELLQRPMTSVPNAQEGVAFNISKQMAWDRALASGTTQDASEALRQAAFFDQRVSSGASQQGGALQAQQIGMKALGSSFADWMQRAKQGRDLTPDELDQLKLVPTLAPDLGHALLRNMTQLVTGSAGAIYGYNQDPSDDEKTRIIKAVLGGATGLAAGHVLAGGPMTPSAIGDRWQGVYINNLLTPGTVAVKGTNDVWAMANGGVIRAEQRMLQAANDAIHGRFGDAATNVKVMAPEALRYYAGEIASWRSGLQKFVDAINPGTVNRPLESYGQPVERAAFEAPSVGQYTGSFVSRAIQGLTDMSQEIIQGGHEAANALAQSKGISASALTEPYLAAQRQLLMGKPEGNMGRLAQRLLDGLSQTPGIGLLLAPFHTIPANLLDKTFEYMPGIGLANMRQGHVQDVLVRQINGLAGLMAARLAFGDGINGAGPQDPALHRAWVADGNQEWSVRAPGSDSWLSMKHLPPPLQGPLRELAAIEDTQRATKGGSNAGIAGLEQFGSAIKSMDFFPQVLSVVDSGLIKNSKNQGEELSRQGETLISRSTSDLVPSYDRAAAQIERGGTKPDALGTQAAGQYEQQGMNPVAAGALGSAQGGLQGAIPGLEKALPDRRDSFGNVQANDVQGLGAAFNPFGLTHTHPNTYANAYASGASEPSKMPSAISVGAGSSIALRPDESARLQQLQSDIARPVVEKYAASPQWGAMSVEQRRAVMQEIDRQSLNMAEQQLLGEMAQKGPIVSRVLATRQAATDSLNARASQAATFIGPSASPKP